MTPAAAAARKSVQTRNATEEAILTAAREALDEKGFGALTMDAIAKRAFDRFAQHGPARDGERPLGLGLPLAKQTIDAHGGRIALVSEPGQGTLVTVDLPR